VLETDANKEWAHVSTDLNTACLKFTVPARGNFGGTDNVGMNRIVAFERPDEPDGLRAFRAKLRQPRWIKSETVRSSPLHDTVRFSFINAFLVTTIV
jgi:hypothetical protein